VITQEEVYQSQYYKTVSNQRTPQQKQQLIVDRHTIVDNVNEDTTN
jgi:hypothetical protein